MERNDKAQMTSVHVTHALT